MSRGRINSANVVSSGAYLDDSYTNKAWIEWLGSMPPSYISHNYNYVTRRIPLAKRFEEMLWEQGATVRQVHHRRCLEFVDPHDAMVFKLRFA